MTHSTQNQFDKHTLIYAPHKALNEPTDLFEYDDTEYRRELQSHMWNLLVKHRGVGLAANQINLNASVFIMKEEFTKQPLFCINPAIHELSDTTALMLEGCLSDPGLFLNVKRPAEIRASWENAEGEREVRDLQGLNARVFLHEYDHLCGILFTDRVGSVKLNLARKKQLKRLQR